jgi:hypothetical protein
VKLSGAKWRTLVSSVRLGRDEYRVIRPARPPRHAPLYEGRLGGQLTVDKAAAVDLACAWWLAARSRHSIVYLPLRTSRATCGDEYGDRRLDLVLLHHSIAFPVSRWKAVRARLSTAAPHTVRLPDRPFPELTAADHEPRRYDDFRDHLRWRIAADTLFLVGSRRAFEFEADQLRELAEDCPAHRAVNPGTHCCAEVETGVWWHSRLRDPRMQLHVESCREHW